MAGYRYAISLRAWHPSWRPERVTEALQVAPSRSLAAGEPRATPRGEPLEGVNAESFWTARLADGGSDDQSLDGALEAVVDDLAERSDFLADFAESGGRLELFIGWFFDASNSGDVLGHRLLAKAAALRLDLSFDVYLDEGDD